MRHNLNAFSRASTHSHVRSSRRDDGYDNYSSSGRHSSGRSSHSDSNVQNELKDLINVPENRNRCGECQASFPTWCSTNLGVFLCGRCASVHRKLLTTRSDEVFSNLKSLSLDRWSRHDIDDVLQLGGNKGNADFWNPKKEPFPFDGDEDKTQVEKYIRDKYILGKFRYNEVEPGDFLKYSGGSNARERSYNADDSENSGYDSGNSYSRKQRSRGSTFSSSSSRGNDTNSRNKNEREDDNNSRQPSLPKRRPNTAGSREAVFDGTADLTQQVQPQANAIQTTGMVQQYYDPATGMIYVDQQQYMGALQQQQQQQMALQQQLTMQQQMQNAAIQQQQQTNKNAIMGLYQRPDLYTSPVEITPTHPLYNQFTQNQLQQHPQNPQNPNQQFM